MMRVVSQWNQWEKCKGLLLSTTLAGDINRQHTFKASAQHSALSSKCEQRHVDSRRWTLNTDLFTEQVSMHTTYTTLAGANISHYHTLLLCKTSTQVAALGLSHRMLQKSPEQYIT